MKKLCKDLVQRLPAKGTAHSKVAKQEPVGMFKEPKRGNVAMTW